MSKITIKKCLVVASFILGWGITLQGLHLPPKGEIDSSVVMVFGQAMTFCAVGLGLDGYLESITTRLNNLRTK